MATISARIDEQLKARAEEVADSIGIPLSSAINIFLRRFVVENGFPFEVKAVQIATQDPIYDPVALEFAVKTAVAVPDNYPKPDHFTYFDPDTNQPITVYNKRKEP